MIRSVLYLDFLLVLLPGPHPLRDCTYHIGIREVKPDKGIQVTGGQPCRETRVRPWERDQPTLASEPSLRHHPYLWVWAS